MYLLGPGLDVCPPVQEDLDGLEVALPGSTVECGDPILAETKLSEDTWSPKRRHAIPTYMSMHYSIYTLHCNILLSAILAYIDPGLDVGSSLAQQSHHLGVTTTSGCDQRSEPTLSKTHNTGNDNRSLYKRKTQNSNAFMEIQRVTSVLVYSLSMRGQLSMQ